MINEGDEIEIYFKNEDAPPYHMNGTFLEANEESIMIRGTMGDDIGKDFIILKKEIKMIGVFARTD